MTNDTAFETILNNISQLSTSDQRRIRDYITNDLSRNVKHSLSIGATASFTTKHGVEISGKVVKINRKTVILHCNTDRYGARTTQTIKWSVSPVLLTVGGK